MARSKSRKEKAKIYESKFKDISRDDDERLRILKDDIPKNKKNSDIDILVDKLKDELIYKELCIVLYEEPEGQPRHRFRFNKTQFASSPNAPSGKFIHVYNPVASSDSRFMKNKIADGEYDEICKLIFTPCEVVIDAYIKTPNSFNRKETYYAEKKLIRPICKPDWDNIGKKYSDMFNNNIWYDDAYVMSGTVNKYYSVLPRVEIKIKYLTQLYNKYQYNKVSRVIDDTVDLSYIIK